MFTLVPPTKVLLSDNKFLFLFYLFTFSCCGEAYNSPCVHTAVMYKVKYY